MPVTSLTKRTPSRAKRFEAEFTSIVKLFGSGPVDENIFVTNDISETGISLRSKKGTIHYNTSSILEISIPDYQISLVAKFVRKEKREKEEFLFVRILDRENNSRFGELMDDLIAQNQEAQLPPPPVINAA